MEVTNVPVTESIEVNAPIEKVLRDTAREIFTKVKDDFVELAMKESEDEFSKERVAEARSKLEEAYDKLEKAHDAYLEAIGVYIEDDPKEWEVEEAYLDAQSKLKMDAFEAYCKARKKAAAERTEKAAAEKAATEKAAKEWISEVKEKKFN